MGRFLKMIRRRPVLRALLTGICLAALAVLLTAQGHTWSKWYTGSWDGASEMLAVGRITQMQQGQHTPGGFLGVYTEDWGDGEGYAILKENLPQEPDSYKSYAHQSGLQAFLLGLLNRLLLGRVSGETRLDLLYFATAALFWLLVLGLALCLAKSWGWPAGLAMAAAVWFAPWLTTGMKNLYWVLWTWLLPVAAGAFLAQGLAQGKSARGRYLLLALAVAARCACGFEYISVLLTLSELPLCQHFLRAKGAERLLWLKRMFRAGLCGLGGALAALLAWLAQSAAYFGSLSAGWANVFSAAADRTSAGDAAMAEGLTVAQNLLYYLTDGTPMLTLAGRDITLLPVLALALAAAGLTLAGLALLHEKERLHTAAAMTGVWLLGVLAPISWLVLSKGHSYVHKHLTPMLWHFAAVPLSLALAAALCWLWVRWLWAKNKAKREDKPI